MKRITATFIGSNVYMGYINGEKYSLIVRGGEFEYILVTTDKVEKLIQYSTILELLEEWTNIQTL